MPDRINIMGSALDKAMADFLGMQPPSTEIAGALTGWIRGHPGWSPDEHERAIATLMIALVDARIRETTGG